jgi:hypothetical protein
MTISIPCPACEGCGRVAVDIDDYQPSGWQLHDCDECGGVGRVIPGDAHPPPPPRCTHPSAVEGFTSTYCNHCPARLVRGEGGEWVVLP